MAMDNAVTFTSAGLEAIFVGYRGSSGFFAGYGNLTASSTGQASGPRQLKGAQTSPLAIPEPQVKPILGDDTVVGSYIFGQTDVMGGVLEFGIEDTTFADAADGVTKKTAGVFDWHFAGDTIANPGTFMVMVVARATGNDAANAGQAGYRYALYLNCSAKSLGSDQWAHQAEGKFRYRVNFDNTSITPFGSTMTTEAGVALRRVMSGPSTYRPMIGCFVGDGAITAIPLAYAPVDTANTKAYNFTDNTALTVSSVSVPGKTATVSAAPGSGKICFVFYGTSSY